MDGQGRRCVLDGPHQNGRPQWQKAAISSGTTRSEQALQAVANRAARVAALCCYRVDGVGGAVATVRAGLESVTSAAAGNRIYCNSNLADTARVVFIDVADTEVAADAVPPGGTAYVFFDLPDPALGHRRRLPLGPMGAAGDGRSPFSWLIRHRPPRRSGTLTRPRRHRRACLRARRAPHREGQRLRDRR